MISATVHKPRNPSKLITSRERRAYLAAFKLRGWTQNEAARRIGKNPGMFSRWLHGEISSAPMRLALDALLAEPAATERAAS
jgi:hypothetical protein